jgi:AcrR family transcriptional regulator
MPRHIDVEVEGRILKAARKLWHQGGEKALSMRAVAKAARTNTPAVYRRFRNREGILCAMLQSYQQELLRVVEPCRSMPEVAKRYLDFALRHPREYQLIMSGLLARMTKERPNLDFLLGRCSEWLAGSKESQRRLVLTLWALLHGTATLKISGSMRDEDFSQARTTMTSAIEVLVANASKLDDQG